MTPANPTIPLGTSQQFAATGNYTDGTTQDLTSAVLWDSNSPTAATIDPAGLATSTGQGQTRIIATYGLLNGFTVLTFGPPALVSIAITPVNSSVALGNQTQFTATGTFTDGCTQDVTTAVRWNSSDITVATINGFGLTSSAGEGSATIDAALGTITASTTVTGSLATARLEHKATLHNNGKVLIMGGDGPGFPSRLDSAELFDPATGAFTPTGSLATARYAHTATLLNNGTVLISGGSGNSGFLASAELY